MPLKALSTYIGELSAGTSIGAGDKFPATEGGAMVYFDGASIGGGGSATVENKDDDFTADGASGTVYANVGATGNIVATLEDSAVGTQYTFIKASEDGYDIRVVPNVANIIAWRDYVSGVDQTVPGNGDWVEGYGNYDRFTLLKISATHWTVISGNPNAND
jgi:hypothetical protein